jgi:LacI family gluconate utilization system Gnt-I transcriptional repressor
MRLMPKPPATRRDRPGLGRATLADVAREAGVAPVTASRALRQPALVAERTRAAVQAAVERLGYIPDLIAGSLASRSSGQVAIVVPSLGTPAFMGTVRGAFDTLRARGYQAVLGDANLSAATETALLGSLLGRRVDALILADVADSGSAREMLRRSGVPVVETWMLTSRPIDMNVGFSNRAAAREATRHLIATGRRRVGMICGPLPQNRRARQRQLGFLDAMRAAGLASDLFAELPFPTRLADAGAALAALVAGAPDLDAVFCSGDTFAVGALLEAQRRGWAVPGRIAIAGLGDLDLAEQMVPAISGARVPGRRMGELAAEMIASRLAGREPAAKIVDVGFEIVVRGSSVEGAG